MLRDSEQLARNCRARAARACFVCCWRGLNESRRRVNSIVVPAWVQRELLDQLAELRRPIICTSRMAEQMETDEVRLFQKEFSSGTIHR